MVAEVVALVGGAPELTGDGVDGLADAVADAGGVDLENLPSGVYSSTSARWNSLGWVSASSTLEPEPTETSMCWPSLVKTTSRVQWPPPRELRVAGNVGNDGFGRAGGVQIAGVVREALDGGGVADVNVLGIGGRIEGDAEGMVEAAGEGLDLRGFAVGADCRAGRR